MKSSTLESFRIQLRVIDALLRRDMLALYGRQGLGFLMSIIEPLIIMSLVMTFVTYRRMQTEMHFPLYAFVITGYGVGWIGRLSIVKMAGALRSSLAFLYHRNITLFDILLSRAIIAVGGASTGLVIIIIASLTFQVLSIPEDMLFVVGGIALAMWYTLALCMLVGVLASWLPMGEKLIPMVSVLNMFSSGLFFMVAWLPSQYRDFVLWFPLVHVTEMMRHGWYGEVYACYFDVYFLIRSNMLISFVALLCLRIYTKSESSYGSA